MSKKGTAAKSGALPPKRQRFVEEYLVDLNATQAAVRAGYSVATANEQGAQLLADLSVAAAVAELQAARSQRVAFTADEVLRELAILTRSDVRDFQFDEDTGTLTLREGAPDSAWRAVSSIKRKVRFIPQKDGGAITERELEFRLWDKNAAIDKAMRHLGLLKDGASLVINNQTNVMTWKFGDRDVPFSG